MTSKGMLSVFFIWCLVIGISYQSKVNQISSEDQSKLNEVIQTVVGAIRPKEKIVYSRKNRSKYD